MFEFIVLNDITTTYPHPPAFEVIAEKEAGRNYSYDPANLDNQKKKYDIGPFPVPRTREATFALVDTIAKGRERWEVVHSDFQRHRLEAVVTTRLMRFKDDVVIEVRDTAAGSLAKGSELEDQNANGVSWVHMRSKSRKGRSDLGANAARIKNFFLEIKNALKNE